VLKGKTAATKEGKTEGYTKIRKRDRETPQTIFHTQLRAAGLSPAKATAVVDVYG